MTTVGFQDANFVVTGANICEQVKPSSDWAWVSKKFPFKNLR